MAAAPSNQFLVLLFAGEGIFAIVVSFVLGKALRRSAKAGHGLLDRWLGMLLVLVIILLPLNLILGAVHTLLIPIPAAWEAVSRFSPNEREWKHGIEEKSSHTLDQWLNGSSPEVQTFLWEFWPILVLIGGLATLAGFLALARFYARLAQQTASNARGVTTSVDSSPWANWSDVIAKALGKHAWEQVVDDSLREQAASAEGRHHRHHRRPEAEAEGAGTAEIPDLSPAARRLLLEASRDPEESVQRARTSTGFEIRTNGQRLAEDPASVGDLSWEAAVWELAGLGLLREHGCKGEEFRLTRFGQASAHALRQRTHCESTD